MEQMSKYNYTFENIELDDGKRADRQTLVVTAADGSTQTVEYTCIGGGEVYLPEFLAMYNVRQGREYLIKRLRIRHLTLIHKWNRLLEISPKLPKTLRNTSTIHGVV